MSAYNVLFCDFCVTWLEQTPTQKETHTCIHTDSPVIAESSPMYLTGWESFLGRNVAYQRLTDSLSFISELQALASDFYGRKWTEAVERE